MSVGDIEKSPPVAGQNWTEKQPRGTNHGSKQNIHIFYKIHTAKLFTLKYEVTLR